MACCALAAFLFSQIVFALDWARERLGLAEAAPRANLPVGWRLDGTGLAAVRPPAPDFARRLRLAAAAGGAAFVGLAAITLAAEAAFPGSALARICSSHGLAAISGANR
jgi:hypothetical protein